jgi:hypothetical protein
MKIRTLVCLASLFAAVTAQAAPVTIGFDSAVGTYVPTPGSIQNVKNEFSSLGIVFQDVADPTKGVTLGQCGPGNGPVSLFGYGNDFPGCGNTRPNFDILFVDPSQPGNGAYTTAFSIFNTDGMIRISAYDALNNLLGQTQAFSGTLSLSGIGNISRVNVQSIDLDPTTLDDVSFEAVTPLASGNVPEPASIALLGLGAIGMGALRRKNKA